MGVAFVSVRCPKDRVSGMLRGFAFVEFPTTAESVAFMSRTQGSISLAGDGNMCRLMYASDEAGGTKAYNAPGAPPPPARPHFPPGFNFVHDGTVYREERSGIIFDPRSGFYLDPHTNMNLYFDSQLGRFAAWGRSQAPYQPPPPPQQLPPPPPPPTQAAPAPLPPTQVSPLQVSPESPPESRAPPASARSSGGAPQQLAVWNQKAQELRQQLQEDEQQRQQQQAAKLKGPIKIGLNATGKSRTPAANTVPTPVAPYFEEVAPDAVPQLAQQPAPVAAPLPPPLTQQPQAPTGASSSAEPSFEITRGLVCLICKRALPNEEKLRLHLSDSDFHKRNLELFKAQMQQQQQQQEAAALFDVRDRAAQRRALFGSDADHEGAGTKRKFSEHSSSSSHYEQAVTMPPTKMAKLDEPLSAENNVGGKMMQKMGWSGAGLGRQEQGMSAPIQVSMNSERSGLGAESETRAPIMPGDTYKSAVLKRARERFERMMRDGQ